jgi:hypothetical protein
VAGRQEGRKEFRKTGWEVGSIERRRKEGRKEKNMKQIIPRSNDG